MASHGSAASRQVALDHILRRLIQQNLRHSSNMQLWNSISRLIPGVTVKQCIQRWQELCEEAGCTEWDGAQQLEAMGRPVSSHPRQPPGKSTGTKLNRSKSTSSVSSGEARQGKETRTLEQDDDKDKIQHLLSYKDTFDRETSVTRDSKDEIDSSCMSLSCQTVSQASNSSLPPASESTVSSLPHPPGVIPTPTPETMEPDSDEHVTINVCDNVRNVKAVFTCQCDLLVGEMGYFANYLSNYPRENWVKADISVHCDVSIFTWLMCYVKKGLYEDAFGRRTLERQSKPSLTPENVVSVLVSSEFLKITHLVEECLEYLHGNLVEVVGSKVNLNCLSDGLVVRLAKRFTLVELEQIKKKDKFRNKLYMKKLFELFDPTFSSSCCPSNASSLYKCLHCKQMLTEQHDRFFRCVPSGLSISRCGEAGYSHQVDPDWEVNRFIEQEVHHGKTCRDLYWLFWGIVNTLRCSRCGNVFQCRDIANCWQHPMPPVPKKGGSGELTHPCCGQKVCPYTLVPPLKVGCVQCDHTVSASCGGDGSSVPSLLVACRELVKQEVKDLESSGRDGCYIEHLLKQQRPHTPEITASASPSSCVIWDFNKSTRWNLDRQREHESSPSLPIPLLLLPNEDQQRTLQLTELLNTLSCQEKMVL